VNRKEMHRNYNSSRIFQTKDTNEFFCTAEICLSEEFIKTTRKHKGKNNLKENHVLNVPKLTSF
jgi:hypothetical protein